MKHKDFDYVKTYLKSYESRMKNNNLDLHMILYSCNHCFEFNPYTKEIRPFNSIFWYNLDKDNENKFYSILKYLEIKHDHAKNKYPYNFTEESIGVIIDNTLAVNLNKLVEEVLPIDTFFKEENHRNHTISECNDMIQEIEKMYSNWNDVMTFVLNNYDKIDKLSTNNWGD